MQNPNKFVNVLKSKCHMRVHTDFFFIYTLKYCVLILVHKTAVFKNTTSLCYSMNCRKNSEYTQTRRSLICSHTFLISCTFGSSPLIQHHSMFISDAHTHKTACRICKSWLIHVQTGVILVLVCILFFSGFYIKHRRRKKYPALLPGIVDQSCVIVPVATISCILALFLCFTLSFSIMVRAHQSISPAFD